VQAAVQPLHPKHRSGWKMKNRCFIHASSLPGTPWSSGLELNT